MDQFNRNTYKKRSFSQEFLNSCFGRIIILLVVLFVLFIVAVMTVPTDEAIRYEVNDNIHQCLQNNDSTKLDAIDENISNISRTFSHADTTLTNQDVYKAYLKYNTIAIYNHTALKTVYLHSNRYPQGIRVGIALFSIVVSTVNYNDMLLDLIPARGPYNERLIKDAIVPDEYIGENPNLKPYHYQGNPED